jgi:diguanylate cyclase (GGDEF)-like protein
MSESQEERAMDPVYWLLHGCFAVGIGVVLGRVSAARVVRRLRARLAEVEHRACHDPLTGLLNRAGLRERFTATMGRERLLVLLDLDGFKAVNDRFGHPTGDVLLMVFADRLGAVAARLGGLAGRLGGDEFVLLFQDLDGTGIGDGILAEVSAPVLLPDPGTAQPMSASAGITRVGPGLSFSDALRQADIALYHAKASEQPVAYFAPGMTHPDRPHTIDRTETAPPLSPAS